LIEATRGEVKRGIADSFTPSRKVIERNEDTIDMDAGGAGIGLPVGEKLCELEDGYVIIGLQEDPTESGVIGARANGFTNIRNALNNLLGFDWTNMTVDELVERLVGSEDTKEM